MTLTSCIPYPIPKVSLNSEIRTLNSKPYSRPNRLPRARIPLLLTLILILLIPPVGGAAAERKMMPNIQWPLEINGWTWDQEDRSYNRENLFDYINGAAEVYLAYNFRQAFVHRFTKAGQPDLVAEVYQLASAEDAYGVFSLERQDPEVGIGQGSEFGGSLLRFWKGNSFVSILGEGPGKEIETAILSLGRALADKLPETGRPPRIVDLLPILSWLPPVERLCFVRSHILLNRCFFLSHQNILHLASDVQALFARYRRSDSRIGLLLVQYPTVERARAALTSFKKAYLPEAGHGQALRTEDGKWTFTELHRKFVLIVFGASLPSEAQALIENILTKMKEQGS